MVVEERPDHPSTTEKRQRLLGTRPLVRSGQVRIWYAVRDD
jgi:hypothetical protein